MVSRRDRGMGLMEVMVAMGVSSMLMLAVMSIIQYSTKASKSAGVATDWTSMKSSIYQGLTTMSTCDPMMVRLGAAYGLTINSVNNYDVEHAVAVPELAYLMGPSLTTVAKTNAPSNGLVIKSMKLWAISPPDPLDDGTGGNTYNKYSVRLQINAERDAALQGSGQIQAFAPYTVDFKVLTGPFGPSGHKGHNPHGEEVADTIQGCVPL